MVSIWHETFHKLGGTFLKNLGETLTCHLRTNKYHIIDVGKMHFLYLLSFTPPSSSHPAMQKPSGTLQECLCPSTKAALNGALAYQRSILVRFSRHIFKLMRGQRLSIGRARIVRERRPYTFRLLKQHDVRILDCLFSPELGCRFPGW